MSGINVKRRQSLLDIAIQRAGSLENIFALASENALSITDDIEAGSLINLVELADNKVVTAYDINGFVPATGLTATDSAFGGINYMGIEIDFIVS